MALTSPEGGGGSHSTQSELLGMCLLSLGDPLLLWVWRQSSEMPGARVMRQFQVRTLEQGWGKTEFAVADAKKAVTCIESSRLPSGAQVALAKVDTPVKTVPEQLVVGLDPGSGCPPTFCGDPW